MKDCLHCEFRALSTADEPCINCRDGEKFVSRDCTNCIYESTMIDDEPCESCRKLSNFKPKQTAALIPNKIAGMETEVKTPETVDHPSHYQGKFECIDEMISLFGVEAVKAFCRCNVYKYRYRADRKNGDEDIKKAEWYMQKLMELRGESNVV